MNEENNQLLSALNYQALGLSIIPVGTNKKPFFEWKQYQDRPATINEINEWWKQFPNANPALVTGKVSGVVVLDLDKKHERTSKEFQIPLTACAKSGNGGEHFFFKYPNHSIGNGTAIDGEGVDFRGDGGYVLLAPSVNESGGIYEWVIPIEDGLAEIPEWLLEKMSPKEDSNKKWLSGKDGVLEGQRNDTATSMTGKIISSTTPELWESIGWEQLKIWNSKNIPPLSERELRNVWESIKNQHTKKEIPNKNYNFIPLVSLMNEPDEEINWVADGLLPSGGFSIMVAKPKVGKSTLARQLALCVAQGVPFLGCNTTKGVVLYVALEEKRSEVKKHFKLLGATGNEDLQSYIGSAPEEANQWLTEEVKNKKPILVIVDTLFRFARVSDVSDYAKVTTALNPLLALARENSTHLMVIHHARKGGGEGGDSTLGSTAIFGSVDTSIILKKTDGKRTIETQQRYGTDMEPTLLVFDEITKNTELGSTKVNDDVKNTESEILDCLKMKEEPLSEPDICEDVNGRTTLKRKALRDLLAKGEITRIGGGKRNDPFLYSCSLVPTIYTGREKQETKLENPPDFSSNVSYSQDSNKNLDDFVNYLNSDNEKGKSKDISPKEIPF